MGAQKNEILETSEDVIFFYPGAPQQEQHGKCPTCGQGFTVIIDLDVETIFQDGSPPGDEDIEDDYCICYRCGGHLWITSVRAFRVTAFGPIPDQLVEESD